MSEEEDIITISKKYYDKLVEVSAWLSAFESGFEDAGVDNWKDYDFAVELLTELE